MAPGPEIAAARRIRTSQRKYHCCSEGSRTEPETVQASAKEISNCLEAIQSMEDVGSVEAMQTMEEPCDSGNTAGQCATKERDCRSDGGATAPGVEGAAARHILQPRGGSQRHGG